MAADTSSRPATGRSKSMYRASSPHSGNLRKYGIPALVVLLAIVILATITWNWNSWEGGRIEQVTDDAYVRGDITPLSTKVAGLVKEVMVSDYQSVQREDLLVQLDDDDFNAQVAQATAAVEAAKAAIEDNRRQRHLQDARIERALAGVDQANAEIVAAQAGKEAAQADVVRHRMERKRQEALFVTRLDDAANGGAGRGRPGTIFGAVGEPEGRIRSSEGSLRSSELAVEAERRAKQCIGIAGRTTRSGLSTRRRLALVGAKVDLGYTRIAARRWHGRREAGPAGATGITWNASDLIRSADQMGSGELSGNAAHQREGGRPGGDSR